MRSMRHSAGLHKIIGTLRSPTYGNYVLGNGISLIGTWMQRIAVGWLTWQLTGSAFWLGVIAFADLFPTVIIGPIAGAVADRGDKLRLIQISQALACLQAAILFALTTAGFVNIAWLAFLSLFLGTVSALNQPARLALLPSLVEAKNFNSAIGINSVIFNLARFIGPAIAGLIIAGGNIAWVFAVNVLSYVVFLVILSRLRLVEPSKSARARKHFFHDLREGLAYTAGHRQIAVSLLLLIAVSLGARPVVELLPGFAGQVFAGGPTTLALLTSTFGAGAIIGGLWLAGGREERNLTSVARFGAIGLAAALILFVASPNLEIALPAAALLGLTIVVTSAGIQTLVQLNVESEMRGRVLSLYGLIIRGGPAVGALTMGWFADWIGLRWSVAGGAGLLLIAVGLITVRERRAGR
ncbi:putative bacilysin exporter BacE [bacterium MnTg02]|nr:putative bacilysin exporter BacE [bacterium MnTg02]